MAARNSKTGNPTQSRAGFTMIDLVITVMIIGIMAAVAAPRYGNLADGYRANAAAKMIANDLNSVRRKAMAASAETNIQFFVSDNKYEITGQAHLNHADASNLVLLGETGYPATLVSASFDGTGTILFDHFGMPRIINVDSTRVPLVSGTIVIQSGSQTRTIVVSPTTGEAVIQ